MRDRPTLREVALATGLSIKTISRVVNDDPNVAPATADRVMRAIELVGYEPNLVARSLKVGRADAIGLVVASLSDPFFAELTAAIEESARERGFFVLIASTGEGARNEEATVSGLLTRQIAGMIMVPTAAHQGYLARRLSSSPLVCVDRPPTDIESDTVLVDNERGAFVATNWLISHGHRRIAFVGGPPDKYTIQLRRAGYERALEEAGIGLDPELLIETPVLPSEVAQLSLRLFDLGDSVTAIFTSNSKASLGVVNALHDIGRTDIAMVGFDDFPNAAALSPAVTVVSQDAAHVGHEAVECLFRRIADKQIPRQNLLLPASLIVRGSGEIPPRSTAQDRPRMHPKVGGQGPSPETTGMVSDR